MSDHDDPMLTISPQSARAARAPRVSSRLHTAIERTNARRAGQREGVNPTVVFVVGIVRNFVLGIPFTGLGFIWAYRVAAEIQKRHATEGAPSLQLSEFWAFLPAAAFLVVGSAFLAPGQVESAARFLGLGGIVDKLPFLRRPPSTTEPPA